MVFNGYHLTKSLTWNKDLVDDNSCGHNYWDTIKGSLVLFQGFLSICLSCMCSLQADHHHLLAVSASAMGFHQEGEMKEWLSFFFHCVSNSGIGNFPSSLFINTGRLFLIKKTIKKISDPIVVYIFIAINELIIEFLTSYFLCVCLSKD